MMAKQRRRPIFLLIVIVVLLVGCVGLVAGYLIVSSETTRLFGPPTPNLTLTQRVLYPLELFIHREAMSAPTDPGGLDTDFTIEQGESVSMVCLRLEQSGLIDDAELFRTYLVYSGLDRQLQSGTYHLNAGLSPLAIAADLLDATPTETVVTVLPGWRIEEVAANVAASGLPISAGEFTAAAYAPAPELVAMLPVARAPSLEGFLFPGSYTASRESDLNSVLTMMLSAFGDNVGQDLLDGFSRQGLTTYEAVTLASIIEKEAVVDDEKPLMASVFYNRLAEGIRLETDPTVQYGLGYQEDLQTWWKSPLSSEDLTVDSAYNTYLIYGLPPTPIANPDLSSLQAVALPAETPYFYFRSACDGSGRHNFATTFEEHLNNACGQ
ncbi:MAG: endolytic transglycosylase MltG [Chloroflexota bacterium]|nr:endolytic transglycosylase MltG [Chloroflexota bacterium]